MDSYEAGTPTEVLAATQLRFMGGVTAFLYQPRVWGFSLIGTVYYDSKDRFRTGWLIRTSDVCEFQDEHGYVVAVTATGSRYVLVEFNLPSDLALEKG
ncbi:hypothetical protein [Pseudomonas coronafaciens]|uniref:hypothetical protein n=1 Tax=Pseudomonas coronafaciens TaxID=53409 RepID=UPI000EFEA746|nr:hypothetical protein [Pseudomonas coronafaciens]